MSIKFKRIVVTMAIVMVIGGLLTGCGMHYAFNWGTGTNYLNKADAKEFHVKKAVVDPITSIEIRSGFAEVELIEADKFYVEIDYLYWEDEPEYTLEDGNLYFDDSNAFPNSYSINFNLNNKIKIYLPKASALSDLSIKDASGDVTLESFVADDMSIVVSYGDFTIKNGAAAKADITLSSGTSNITDFQVGKLDFTNSYGNANFSNINTGEPLLASDITADSLNISMSSGNVKINGLNIGSLDISNSYGNISCKDITADDFESDLSSGALDVKDADFKDIDISNSYGDVTLQLLGPETDYSYDLDTSYGNIKVGNKDYEDGYKQDNSGEKKVAANLSSGDIDISFQ